MSYEFLPHTADIKFKAFGKTLNSAFASTAHAIAHIISAENTIQKKKKKIIKIKGTDKKNLLYNFIEELIHLLDTENFIIANAKVEIRGNALTATLSGDDAKNYSGLDHIKSPTYSEMQIKKTKTRWEVQVVVDV